MTKEEFIKLMIEHNYSEEEIEEMLDLIEETREQGLLIKYEDILLSRDEE